MNIIRNEYALGTDVTCSAVFKNASGVAADPTAVMFSVKDPDDEITTYTYGVGIQIVKDSAGHYHINVDANKAGTWFYRFFATGTGKAADEREFRVATSQFD